MTSSYTPGSATPLRCQGEFLRGATRQVDALQFPIGEEGDCATVRVPERVAGVACAPDRCRYARVERSNPELEWDVAVRDERELPAIRRERERERLIGGWRDGLEPSDETTRRQDDGNTATRPASGDHRGQQRQSRDELPLALVSHPRAASGADDALTPDVVSSASSAKTEIARRLKPRRRILLQTPADDTREALWNMALDDREIRRILLENRG